MRRPQRRGQHAWNHRQSARTGVVSLRPWLQLQLPWMQPCPAAQPSLQ
ncbi:MAG TPA: hypothetical protein VFO48_01995 [Vicinamibacterales bacterium]|nr:hypothetical protein [Vicinamibacterales bacterium]